MQLPQAFLDRAKIFSGDEYEYFIRSLEMAPPVSVRMNPYKLSDQFSTEERISWSSNGKYLRERPLFTLDPLFHAGCYYVQEASSQFLEQPFLQVVKNVTGPKRILDLCAAPGGKSTHLLSLLNEEDLLVSNEIIQSRNSILRHNIAKWGTSNVIVTQNDPGDYSRLPGFFDVILADAPCSGEGLFRKDPDAVNEWSPENVDRCTIRQREILSHAYVALKPGGFLIYSTCTYEELENDTQISSIIENFSMRSIPIENVPDGVVRTQFGLAFYPHRIRGEGFYISILQKGEDENGRIKQKKSSIRQVRTGFSQHLNQYLKNPDHFIPLFKNNRLFAIPEQHMQSLDIAFENLYVRMAGVYIGEVKNNDLIPSESLALFNQLNPVVPCIDLPEVEAIEYLRGGNPKTEAPKGWNIISFKNHHIGWIKNLGNRNNNYYPKEWRIRNARS